MTSGVLKRRTAWGNYPSLVHCERLLQEGSEQLTGRIHLKILTLNQQDLVAQNSTRTRSVHHLILGVDITGLPLDPRTQEEPRVPERTIRYARHAAPGPSPWTTPPPR